MNKKKSFILYTDYIRHIEKISDDEAGKLFKAILRYAESGEIPDLPPRAEMAFSFMSEQMRRDMEKYEEKCEKNRAIAKRRWEKVKSETSVCERIPNDTDNENDTVTDNDSISLYMPHEKNFIPPTVEEVRTYCNERGNGINPEYFFDYYSANGWKIGQNLMRDWRAAVRAWEHNAHSKEKDDENFDVKKYEEFINVF